MGNYLGIVAMILAGITFTVNAPNAVADAETRTLQRLLKKEGFTGKVEDTLGKRLGRKLDPTKVDLGRLVFFDRGLGLHKSNSCAGCHSPTHGFGDTQSIAIGIQNNDIVGIGRTGPRNQRRTPTIANTAFYPVLMWNGRFASAAKNPFDNSKGFIFPPPEGKGLFLAKDPRFNHLLVAQAHIPFTELPEMTGFHGAKDTGVYKCQIILPKNIPFGADTRTLSGNQSPFGLKLFKEDNVPPPLTDYCQFDDELGTKLPKKYPDNDVLSAPIRHLVLQEINQIEEYRKLFGDLYPQVRAGNGIEFWMIGQVLAEFQMQQTFAKAPIDNFAQGNTKALSLAAKRGAIVFFRDAKCVACHAVKGKSNEMFSDFAMHNAGVPQIAPVFGKLTGNVAFRELDGTSSSAGQLDLGRFEFEDTKPKTKFMFRTSPLRNVSLQAAFFHNGSFTKLEDAVRYHVNTLHAAKSYDPVSAGVPSDLKKASPDPTGVVLATLDHRLANNPELKKLKDHQIKDLVIFLSEALLDARAKPDALMSQIPISVPSGASIPKFVKP